MTSSCRLLTALSCDLYCLLLTVWYGSIQSWDVCAAEAVMKASGGGFSDIYGNPLVYSRFAISSYFVDALICHTCGTVI